MIAHEILYHFMYYMDIFLDKILKKGEGELELFYNDRESITNDSSKGILIVISLAHESFCIRNMWMSTMDMLHLTRMIR